MTRTRGWALAVGLIIGILLMSAYRQITTFDSEAVTDDVHVIYGLDGPWMASGNVGVLRTSAGAIVVDTMTFGFHGRWIMDFAEKLTGRPVQAVVNTHYHQDHTHGNPAFPTGTKVYATKRTRELLIAKDRRSWGGEARSLLPNELIEDTHELRVGGKTIRMLHLGRGHTDGDLVVLFVEDRVLMTGDLVFHEHYPNIDLEGGASLPAWDATLDRVLALDFDRVIAGHGPVTDRAGIQKFQTFIRELWQLAQAAASAGTPLDEFQRTAALKADAGYANIRVPFFVSLDREFVLKRAWQEATGAVRPDAR